jgi:hypothetical protein
MEDNARAWGEPAPQNRPPPFVAVNLPDQQQQAGYPPPQPPVNPRNISMTPSPPPPPKRRKSKIAKHNFLLAAFHFISAYLLVGIVALGFLAHSMDSLNDVQVDPDLRRIPNIMWFSCIVLIVTLAIGIFASLWEDKNFAYGFIGLLALLLFMQFIVTVRLKDHTGYRLRTLTKHWDELPPMTRSAVQYVGNCCGYRDPLDRPGEFCPHDAKDGCKVSIKEAVYGVNSVLNWAFFCAIIVAGTLAVLIYFIACREKRLE